MRDLPIDVSVPYIPGQNQIKATYGTDIPGKDSKHYVMWSGGTDSTLLLYELLMTYGPEHVIAISYKYPWLTKDKYENEKAHRIAFLATMQVRGLGGFKHMELTISQTDIMGNINYDIQAKQGAGLPQAVAWLLSVPLYAEEGAYIYDGCIKNDDLVIRLEHYTNIFRGVSGVMRRDLTLRQPYLNLSKENILEKLIGYDLYSETWFCEMPNGSSICNKCKPCNLHKISLSYLASNASDKMVKTMAAHYLKQMQIADISSDTVAPVDINPDNASSGQLS